MCQVHKPVIYPGFCEVVSDSPGDPASLQSSVTFSTGQPDSKTLN